ncbi:PliI family lysozyme inhibitor of I-type lysozyme [Simiduia sp. 21SJ11W-1]|uniref:PliI family lysozyme inhibitor of I-type lysozyme n=1 Tax=Simiduia sp. 21SJ11W-1 TaxID=2909669 RepID=UPI0020A18F18|nr:PliI family lysozyme inhibitor of I-type lysozyme [Simiduia sp. 21SJ11W-1]UTA48440.1 PliI family lysozyme inhibitor of I-type lysozyme [Simiduia sp. 21SJ11W-1]
MHISFRACLVALVFSLGLVGCDAPEQHHAGVNNTELTVLWGENSFEQPLYAVVAEGAGEPKSIGSYSVRIYTPNADGGKRDFFLAGEVFSRDGFLKSITLADVDGDQLEELVVVLESVGTGSYVTAHAWHYLEGHISVIASAENLLPEVDMIAALKAQIQALNALEPSDSSRGPEQ